MNCADMLSPTLLNLFIMIFESGICSTTWIIAPFPKKVALNNVDNYHGKNITLGKICYNTLNMRINKWSIKHKKISEYQFDFQANKSAVDCNLWSPLLLQKRWRRVMNCTAHLSIFKKHLTEFHDIRYDLN